MKNLYTKLFKITNELEAVIKKNKNPFFKSNYASLNSVLEELKPHLLENKVLLIQPVNENKIETILVDTESGEELIKTYPLPEGVKSQDLGSAITFGRRYSLVSLFAMEQEDDDGNKAQGKADKEIRNPTVSEKQTVLDYIKNENSISLLNGMYNRIDEAENIEEEDKEEIKKALEEKLNK